METNENITLTSVHGAYKDRSPKARIKHLNQKIKVNVVVLTESKRKEQGQERLRCYYFI